VTVMELYESIVIFALFFSMNPLVQSKFGSKQWILRAMAKPMSVWHIFRGIVSPSNMSSLQSKVVE
jgi:hypothetical protein